jgi:hypothetical protein
MPQRAAYPNRIPGFGPLESETGRPLCAQDKSSEGKKSKQPPHQKPNAAFSASSSSGRHEGCDRLAEGNGETNKLFDTPYSAVMSKKAQVLPDKYASREKTELNWNTKSSRA